MAFSRSLSYELKNHIYNIHVPKYLKFRSISKGIERNDLLGKHWINELVKEWNESQDQQWIDNLHLIWFDNCTTNHTV